MKHLKELIDEQQWELERAIIGRGKYEYKHLEVCETDWFRMTKQQREKLIQNITNTKLKYEGHPEEHVNRPQSTSLSISAEQFHSDDLKKPLSSIKDIWTKAEELLAQTDSIIAAPGCEKGSKMVKSRSGK